MKGNLKIVLADRDGIYLQRLKRSLERKGEMTVVGMADSGNELVRLVQAHQADVVLMDIILRESDGFWAMEQLQRMGLNPITIVISAMDSDKMVRRAIGVGVDYYMAKPVQGELLIERIYQLAGLATDDIPDSIQIRAQDEVDMPANRSVHLQQLNLEAEISAVLSRMGISASIKGYHFIRRAVMMATEEPEVLIGITKGLYPDLAKMFKTSSSKVERAIRHAIESAWKKNGPQVYFELAGYMQYDKPTNGQFIAVLAEYFRLGLGRGSKSA